MSTITNKLTTTKVAAALIAVALSVGLLFALAAPQAQALTEDQIQSILSLLSSFGAGQAVIDDVNAALRGQPTSGSGTSGTSSVCPYTWTRSLTNGMTGDDVMKLQQFLNDKGITVASSGAGSPGNETTYYGSLTGAAVKAFQEANAADVLTPLGLTSGTTYFGPSTRAEANSQCTTASTEDGDTTTPPAPAGTALAVAGGTQPLASLAPQSASRVPFTRFTVTAGTDGDVTLNSVIVERRGLAVNTVFSGVVLVDETTGDLVGLAKTLNSNNQATIGDKITVKAGTSKTFLVAGNMAASLASQAGQVVGLAVIGVNSSATVSGSLPITGAFHTVNASLAIGTVTAQRGSLDPAASAPTKEVGTTGYTFASVRLTTGSQEDVTFKGIRWYQAGSVSASDLDNIVTVVDGVEYPTTVSSDGKYYSSTFGTGIVVKEGLNADVSVKGDIVSGSNRTVNFDIYEDTDINLVGQTFGYGITTTIGGNNDSNTSSDDSEFNDGTSDGGTPPFYDGDVATVGAGTLVVSSTNDVPAGDIANGCLNCSLGSFEFDVKGEPISWTQLTLTVATTSSSGTATTETITNVTIVDGNGTVLAGPADLNGAGTSVVLADTVTLPVGKNQIIVKGNLDNDWANDDTIIFSINTPATKISTVRGDVTNNTITPTPSAQVSAKTQTVSTGAVTVAPAASFVSQNIIDGANNALLGVFTIDATNSGEDLRIRIMQFRGVTGINADLDELNTLQIFKDGVALNTGSNINDPSGNTGAADANLSFTLDGTGLVIPKGTTVTIELRGNINASSTPTAGTTYAFDFSAGSPNWTVTGVNTGTDISETLVSSSGATLTVTANGTLTVSVDSSDPTEAWYVSGQEATIGVFDFLSTNEQMKLTDLEIVISGASSSPADFTKVSLWKGTTKLDEKSTPAFTADREAFTFALNDFVVPADDNADLTIKAAFAEIGTSKAGTSGNKLAIGTSTIHREGQNKATGLESGASVEILGSAGTTTGARYFRTLPTVSQASFTQTTLANGTKELYRVKIAADPARSLGVYKMSFNVATTNVTTTAFKVTEVETGKIVANSLEVDSNGDLDVVVSNGTYGAVLITVPAGGSYTYKLEGTVANAGTANETESVDTKFLGDAAVVSHASTIMLAATAVDSDANDDFIWSPMSTTTSVVAASNDWTNGFRIRGIEFDDLGTVSLSN